MAKSFSGLLLLAAFGIGLMAVGTKPLEKIKPPEEVKAQAPINQEDVLSAADARQWRQEFLWHRNIRKTCANSWIDDKKCARVTQGL